jgi:hypothetical protein
VIEIFHSMGRRKSVTVVAGGLVIVQKIRVVAVDAHLGLIRTERLVLGRSLPVDVAAPGRDPLRPVLAEVAVKADVTRRSGRLRRVVTRAAGIDGRAVGQRVEIRCRLVQPPARVRQLDEVVAVVARRLVSVLDVGVVAVDTHLGLIRTERLVLGRPLPVDVAASGRDPLRPVLAEVAVKADVTRRGTRLRRIVAQTARVVSRVVGQGVKIRCDPVEPPGGVWHSHLKVTVVTERSVPETVVDFVTGNANRFLGRPGEAAVIGRPVGPSSGRPAPGKVEMAQDTFTLGRVVQWWRRVAGLTVETAA